MDEKPVLTLHYFPFSLYSLIARLAFVLGTTLDPESSPAVEVKLVNLHRNEHLSEAYLTKVNQKGQVPALTSSVFSSPLNDSQDICNWLCEQQPKLLPIEHRETIQRLLAKIYSFPAMALLIPSDDRKYGITNDAAATLERTDLTEEHRRALEIKSVFHDTVYSRILEPNSIEETERQAANFLEDLGQVLEEQNGGGTWIFGDRPTVIDAHATAFAARLLDTKKEELLPEAVRAYVGRTTATPEWDEVTHGRGTMWNVSMGHVADLNPL